MSPRLRVVLPDLVALELKEHRRRPDDKSVGRFE
jgi:hypothetical protein